MIFNICKNMIESNNYIKDDLLKKLDIYLLLERITEEEYIELVTLINEKEM